MLLALLDDSAFLGRFAIDGCARNMRMILNGDELAAVTSALTGAAALHGTRSAPGVAGPAIAIGSPRGGHFILPPRLAWHPEHAAALEAAVSTANARAAFDGCALLELA